MDRWVATDGVLALVLVAGAWGVAGPPAVQTEGLVISLAVAPSRPARHEGTTFEITVRDATGNPVAGARVSLDLTMPGMAMAEHRPTVLERGAGGYVAVGTFSMGGEWLATVEVLQDGRRVRAEFRIRVR